MSLAEIATASGLSKTQVKSHLQHGRARLRRALAAEPR
jgi:DNA-directed RNA polymerase specialized sigma24 family protein